MRRARAYDSGRRQGCNFTQRIRISSRTTTSAHSHETPHRRGRRPARLGLAPDPGSGRARGGCHVAGRAGRARRRAGAFRPRDPRHRPAADGRLRGAAAPARRVAGKERAAAGARTHRARCGRRPGARPGPRRGRLHGETVPMPELTARVRALLRRSQAHGGPRIVHGPLALDTVARRAFLKNEPLELAAREWAVLEVLLGKVEKIVSKEAIIQAVAGWGDDLSPNAIEVYVSRLRSKLEPAGIKIRTVRGFGYMLEEFKGA